MKKERETKITAVPLLRIKKTGIFDLQKVYESIHSWFLANQYLYMEKEQTEKVLPDGKEIVLVWFGFRKVDDYTKFWIYVTVLLWRGVDVVVEEDGKKVRKVKGDLEINFKSVLEKNYLNKFKSEFLRILYEKYLIKNRLERQENKLREETYELNNAVKDRLRFLNQ